MSLFLRHVGTLTCIASVHYLALPARDWLASYGLSDALSGFVLTQGVGISVYWIWACIFHSLDCVVAMSPRPSDRGPLATWLARRKLRPNAPEPPFFSLVPSVLLNQLQTFLLGALGFFYLRPNALTHAPVSLASSCMWIAIYLFIADFEFFFSHRVMHHYARVYQAVHKYHHSTYGTTAISAIAMHPIDFFFEGALVVLGPPLLCGVALQTGCAYGALASFNSTITHSGWDFPVLASPHSHFLHHSKQHVNFGILVSDKVCGTEDTSAGPLIKHS
jgi:sterol desaturase/sphingolipid hydroxylase (fatty acid hydroxylase superfamily)